MSSAGDQQLKLQLRALNESQAESSRLKNLVELAALDPGRFCCRFITYILLPLQHDVSPSVSAFDKLLCICHVTHGMMNNCLLDLITLNQRCPHFLLATTCFQSCCTHAYLRHYAATNSQWMLSMVVTRARCLAAYGRLTLTLKLWLNLKLLVGRAVEIATRRRGTRAPQSVANSSGSNVTEQSEDSARFMYNSRGVPRRHAVRLDGDQAERLNREDEQSGVSCVVTQVHCWMCCMYSQT